MKIAWFCIPAHGHTNPTLGLVKELTSAGHQVFYFSFAPFREKIEAAGAHFIGCDGYDLEMKNPGDADRVSKDMAFATELLVSSTLALDDMVSEQIAKIKPDLIVSDIIYYPAMTPLLRDAAEIGCPYFNGKYMLLYQGAQSFFLWTGKKMPTEKIKEMYFAQEDQQK